MVLMIGSNKHKDNFHLFVSTPEIIDRIEKIREKIKLPDEILLCSDDTKLGTLIEEWTNNMADTCDEMQESPAFKQELLAIKDNFKDQKITHKEAEEQNYKLYLKLPINYLTHSVNEIVSEYDLPKFYDSVLRSYITTGKINFMGQQSYAIRPNYLNDKNNNSIDIIAYEPLTDKDLTEIKQRVNNHFKNRGPKKTGNIKNVDLDLAIVGRLKNRKYENPLNPKENYTATAREIAEIISEDFNTKVTEADVYEAPRKLERLRKKRFGIK